MDFIEKARDIVDELRTLDKRCLIFGALHHCYRFKPLLSEFDCNSFEKMYQLELPVDYRRYLIELGNGGPGPDYGIKPLRHEESIHLPFPYREAFFMDEDKDDFEDPLPGTLNIADGGGTDMLLIVKGACSGQIWYDSRTSEGIFPELDDKGFPRNFSSWWLFYMGNHLEFYRKIENLMRKKSSFEDIYSEMKIKNSQLSVFNAILSILNCDPDKKPKHSLDTPWGTIHGLAKEEYESWLNSQ